MTMQPKSSKSTGRVSGAIAMFGPSPRNPQVIGELTSSVEVSPALTYRKSGLEPELLAMKMAVDCGARCTESFAHYDHNSSSWKTLQTSLFGGLTEFSETWPRAGISLHGNVYRLAPWVPDIREIASLPWVWISTPTAAMSVRSKRFQGKRTLLTPGEVAQGLGGKPNPEWIESLMGFPIGWTALDASEMQ
jgi:hypothetical protein